MEPDYLAELVAIYKDLTSNGDTYTGELTEATSNFEKHLAKQINAFIKQQDLNQ